MTRGTRLGGAALVAALFTMTNAWAVHLEWGSFLGGSGADTARAVTLDGSGNVLVAGETLSTGWVSGGWDTTLEGREAFVVKLTGAGAHVWSSYAGGTLDDYCNGIAADAAGNVYITGYSRDASSNWTSDAFVTKVGPDGAHAWTAGMGGSQRELGHGIAVDGDGSVYVTGETGSTGWVADGYNTTYGGGDYDGFLVKLNAAGGHLWSTYLAGPGNDSGRDVVVRSDGDILAVGDTLSTAGNGFGLSDLFVVRMTAAGAYVSSSLFGGAGNDVVGGAVLDASDNLHIAGHTGSGGWAAGGADSLYGGGAHDGFAAKISPAGTMLWSTYLGGAAEDRALDIALDGAGNVCVAGWTNSANWVGGAWNARHNSGFTTLRDGFAAKLSPDGAHLWSTYTGTGMMDTAQGVAADAAGNVFVAGDTESGGWLYGGWDTEYGGGADGFVLRISGWLETGALQVFLDPAGAAPAGARWRLTTEEAWHESGETLTGLAAGPWWVEFRAALGYAAPEPVLVSVPSGGTAVETASYTPRPDALSWGSFLGGAGADFATDIASDGAGGYVVVGHTTSSGWVSGGWDVSLGATPDAFVVKLTADYAHVWSTFLGGDGDDRANSVAVDGEGNILVGGDSTSIGWVSGGWDLEQNGGTNGFIVKMSASGSPLWSTFVGGGNSDYLKDLAADGDGNVYGTGYSSTAGWVSGGWNTVQQGSRDAYLVKLSPLGAHLWSTYLGGKMTDRGHSVAVDSAGNAIVMMQTSSSGWVSGGADGTYADNGDAAVVKLSPTGAHLWSSYVGGNMYEYPGGVAVGNDGTVFMTGWTNYGKWTSGGWGDAYKGGYDIFVVALSGSGSRRWSALAGGAADDYGTGITVAADGSIRITGFSASPLWVGGGPNALHNGGTDAFLLKASAGGVRQWSTYLGAAGNDEASSVLLDPAGTAHIVGTTTSTDWTLTGGWDTVPGGGEDGFVIQVPHVAETASLTVTLSAAAAAAGARWRFSSEDTWHESGETLTGIAAGQWIIVFEDLMGLIPPENRVVTLSPGGSFFESGDYTVIPLHPFPGTYLGGAGNDSLRGMAVDDAGGLYVTGNGFVAKYGPDLQPQWSFTVLGQGEGVALDAGGNVYAIGTTTSSGWVSGGYDTSLSGSDGFLVKLSPNGTHLWSTYLGNTSDTNYDAGHAVAVDSSGNAIAAGASRCRVFDPHFQVVWGNSTALWKISPDGLLAGASWDTRYANGGGQSSVTADPYGNFYWSSEWSGGLILRSFQQGPFCAPFQLYDFLDAPMLASDREGNVVAAKRYSLGVMVRKYSPSATLLWETTFGEDPTTLVRAVACDRNGDIYLTGNTITDGWVAGGPDLQRDGGDDAYLVKLSAEGEMLWSTYLGGEGTDIGTCLAVDTAGTIHIGGETRTPNWLTDGFDTSHNGGVDGFIARIDQGDVIAPWGTVVINGNRSATNSAEVVLSLTWDDGLGSGVGRMRFSNNGSTWSPWEPVAATRAWTLPAGDGYRTVRVQYLDRAGNCSDRFSDFIRVDATPPTGTIVINDNRSAATSPKVTLSLTWDDAGGSGVTRMRFSINGHTWSPWEPLSATRAYTLPSVPGHHTVRVTYRDGAGNISDRFSDYIRLDFP